MSVEDALKHIGSGRRIVASPGCGAPSTLLGSIGERPELVAGSTLYSGLLLDGYPFLDAVAEGIIHYATWHVMPDVRQLVDSETVDFFPIRATSVPSLLSHLDVDVALIRVSPPDRFGFCSLGPSVSYPLPAVRQASLVVAEIDETCPRTRGESDVHISDIQILVESNKPMPEYSQGRSDGVSEEIARHIVELLPPRPTIQLGIGRIPEALTDRILTEDIGGVRFAGMAVDAFVDLHDSGLIDSRNLAPYPPIMAAELMGSRKLMEFAHENPLLGVYSTRRAISASSLQQVDRFVSINSAIEIDLRGQVNSEWVGHSQLSGVGGSIDFAEAALHSDGGLRILALSSINLRDGSSKIVTELSSEAPVTLPRHTVEYVVTEYGAARLDRASTEERTRALISIAHPDHRQALIDGHQVPTS